MRTRCRCCARRVGAAGGVGWAGRTLPPGSRTCPTWPPRSASSPARSAAEWTRPPAGGPRSRPRWSTRLVGDPPRHPSARPRPHYRRHRHAERACAAGSTWTARCPRGCAGRPGSPRPAPPAGGCAGRGSPRTTRPPCRSGCAGWPGSAWGGRPYRPRPAGWRPAASRRVAGRQLPGQPPAPVGRHAEAEPADCSARPAGRPRARADALSAWSPTPSAGTSGPARDRLEPPTEQDTLQSQAITHEWRARVRLEWVGAETALLAGDAARAVEIGRTAQRISRKAILISTHREIEAGARRRAGGSGSHPRGRPSAPHGLPRSRPTGPDTASVSPSTRCWPASRRTGRRGWPRANGGGQMPRKASEKIPPRVRVLVRLPDGPHVRPAAPGGEAVPAGLSPTITRTVYSHGGVPTSRGVMHDQLRPALRRIPVTSVLICDERRGVRDGLAAVHVRRAGRGPGRHRGQRRRQAGASRGSGPTLSCVGTQRAVDTGHRAHPPAGLPAPAGLRAGLRRRRRHRQHRRRGGLRRARLPALGRVARGGLRGAGARAGRASELRRAAAGQSRTPTSG